MPLVALSTASRLRLQRLLMGLGMGQVMNEKAMYQDLARWIHEAHPSLLDQESLSEDGLRAFRGTLIAHRQEIGQQAERIQAIPYGEQRQVEEANFNTYIVAVFVKVQRWEQQQTRGSSREPLPPVQNLLALTGEEDHGSTGQPRGGKSA